ncbi:hypothetical protein [Streptomyces griseoluteus]
MAQQQLPTGLAGHKHARVVRSFADRLRELDLPCSQEALQSFVGVHRTA